MTEDELGPLVLQWNQHLMTYKQMLSHHSGLDIYILHILTQLFYIVNVFLGMKRDCLFFIVEFKDAHFQTNVR
jgi:hypothetical protein